MGWEIRAAGVDELAAVVRASALAFGFQPNVERIDEARDFLELDRVVVAVDGEEIVGTAGALSLEVTVPGPASVRTAGVTYVGVLPSHRRRGILTALMGRVMDDARRREEPLCTLLASESSIYRRFGYGVAVMQSRVEIERAHARLRQPVAVGGRTRMIEPAEMAAALAPLHDRYRRHQPGEIGRNASLWTARLREPEIERGGASRRFAVVWEDGARRDDGYVLYRIKPDWSEGLPAYTLSVDELVAVRAEVRAALWRYCFDVDLVSMITASNLAVDEPLRWMLADPRRLRVTGVKDSLWIRILDVVPTLSARTYAASGRLVIEVIDERCPDVAGRYRIEGGGGEPAACRRTTELPDLSMDVAELASTYLGGVRFATLEQAGLVAELVPGAVARAEMMFAIAPGPTCCTTF